MKKSISSVCFSLLFLTGCASYNASSLLSQNLLMPESAQKKELAVVAKAFDQADCIRYLDRNVLAKGYQPVQICIMNNSDKSYLFSLDKLDVTCVPAREVANKVHTSTVGRAVGYGVGALVLWPLAIPAIIDGIGSAKANDALDSDFLEKAATNQLILPYSNLNKILFIPADDYQGTFSLTLVEQDSGIVKKIQITPN